MSKIITLWGSAGSGKSALACALAGYLTRNKETAILLSFDQTTPMLPVWIPQNKDTEKSIGGIFDTDMDSIALANHTVIHPRYPDIGMMGYTKRDTPLSFGEPEYGKVRYLIEQAAKITDYVIVDCNASLKTTTTPAALEVADVAVRMLTPDLRGVSYLTAVKPLLQDEKFRFDQHMVFVNGVHPFHPVDALQSRFGRIDGVLPYDKNILRASLEGGMFEPVVNKKVLSCMMQVEKRVTDGSHLT